MPMLDTGNAHIHYTDEGRGPETIVFSHGLLFSGEMFRDQVDALSSRYRCITFDHRGQGQSGVTEDGYDMDTLTEDAIQLLDHLGATPCHFVGLSMGGFVGMRLAIRRPELLKSLILIETAAGPEPKENHGKYKMLNFIARWFGLGVVAGKVMPIMFGQSFLNDPAKAKQRAYWRDRIVGGDRLGITRAVRGVIERDGVEGEIGRITTPTLILVGDEDVATTPEKSELMHAGIPGSQLTTIPQAGHSSTIEQPEAVNHAIETFLASLNQPQVAL